MHLIETVSFLKWETRGFTVVYIKVMNGLT